MRVLVTGAAGFFGRALVRAFARGGDHVVAADILPPDEFAPRSDTPSGLVEYVVLDVGDPAAWSTDVTGPVDGIVHAAALTPSIQQTREDPAGLVRVNLVGTLNALEFVRQENLAKFLFISSAGVYNQFEEEVLDEADADGGFSLYGSAKLAAEIMLFRYSNMFGFDAGAIRPTSMYGPAEEFRNTRPFVTQAKQLADAALDGVPVRVIGLDDRCDWVFVDDVAESAHRFYSGEMGRRSFAFSSGNPIPFSDVLDAAVASFGVVVDESAEMLVDATPDRATTISCDRARAELGWNPIGIAEGMQRYADLGG
ncbi:MAG: NAD(P)-dependent oxidoreductase [bacterium]|nr:NAD(P)-dependent oxidoreductase [bacterium]